MVLPASLAPAFPPRNCPFLVQSIFLASHKLPPHFRMSERAASGPPQYPLGCQFASHDRHIFPDKFRATSGLHAMLASHSGAAAPAPAANRSGYSCRKPPIIPYSQYF